MMKNYMESLERRQEDIIESNLNNQLQKLIDLADNASFFDENKMIQVFEKIIKVYYQLDKNGCDYDRQDAMFRKKKLAEMRYKKLKKEEAESRESESWNEFKEEERFEDLKEDEERD